MNHRKVISPTSLAGFLALLATVAALAAVLTTSTLVEAQTQVPAVTGVSVQPGANAGELDVSWDAHPDGADDYRVSWAPQGENFRTWTNTNWNAYPTGTSLNITGLESGAAYKVKVRARFDEGPNSRWSAVKGATTRPANSAATGLPTASGTALVGETLTVGTSGISDGNGLSNPGFTYQWVRSVDGADTDITSATGSTFLLTYDELDHTVGVRVSFTDDDGYPETLTSAATGTVVRPPNASPSGRPAVSGVLAVGKTLTADTSGITDPNGLSNPAFTYQWVRVADGTNTNIAGATGPAYTPASGDEGAAFKVTVAFTDDDGYAETLTSDPTEVLETEGQDGQGNGVQPRVAPTDSPQNLRATTVSYATVTLEWDEPDNSIVRIRMIRTGGNLPDFTTDASSTNSRDTVTFEGLEPDTLYTFTVEYGSFFEEYGPAATINVRTLPIPAPTNVRVDSQETWSGGVRVTFKWDNPAQTLFLETSFATYDENMQSEANRSNWSQLLDSRRLTIEPDTTHNFATWYRTEDASGAFHEGPRAYLEFTRRPLAGGQHLHLRRFGRGRRHAHLHVDHHRFRR